MDKYGIKELYSVALKATYNMEFCGREYEPEEIILSFDRIMLAGMSQHNSYISANGGYDNQTLITWDNTKDVTFSCSEGVLSKKSIGVIGNSKIKTNQEIVPVPIIGEEQDSVDGIITLNHLPNGTGFIYSKLTGEKLYSNIDSQTYSIDESIIADYQYDYTNGADIIEVGNNAFKGYLKLEGKMRLKDDNDGHDKTAIITIPRIRIASSLNMRLGKNANPTVGNFSFIGYPVGMKGSQRVCDIQILNDDIDSDF